MEYKHLLVIRADDRLAAEGNQQVRCRAARNRSQNTKHGEHMKSWLLENTGRESLRLANINEPKPGPGQILVRTTAVSLNFRDKLIIERSYPLPLTYPLVPGSDLACKDVGLVSRVSRFKVGEQVVCLFMPKWLRGGSSRGVVPETPGGSLSAGL